VREQSRLGNIPVIKLGRYCRYRLGVRPRNITG
jgi:hypothetical protein